MNWKQLAGVAALVGALGIAGCGKKAPKPAEGSGAPPAKPVSGEWQSAYGFASRIPQTAEFYGGWYSLKGEWDGLLKSKFWKEVSANPLLAPAFAKAAAATPEEKAARDEVLGVLGSLFGAEWFLSCGPGTGAGLAWMRDVGDEVRFAQLFAGIGISDPLEKATATQAALGKMLARQAEALATAKPAPLLFGFRVEGDKSKVQSAIGKLEAKLPPEAARTDVEGPDKAPFKSAVFTGAAFLQGPAGETIRGWISKAAGDNAESAQRLTDAFGKIRVELAYGWVGDYLLVSFGADRSALQLAASPAQSILALPENAVAKNYATDALLAYGWGSKLAMEALRQQFRLTDLLKLAEPHLSGAVSAEDLAKLKQDAARIDGKGAGLWGTAEAMVTFTTDAADGWHGEVYGGLRPGSFDYKGKLPRFGVVESAVLEVVTRSDAAYGKAALAWFEDLCATAWQTTKRMAGDNKQQLVQVEAIALPQVLNLWRILKDEFAASLGSGGALVLDAEGALPEGFPPGAPGALADKPIFPRAAVVREVADAALLAKSWQSLFAWAQGLATFAPPGTLPGGELPQPQKKVEGDLALWSYALPMDTGDLLPHVARKGKDLVIFSTSPKLSAKIAGAKPAAEQAGGMLVRVRFTPVWTAADRWVEVVAANPEAFFAGDEAGQQKFKSNEAATRQLLGSLRSLETLEIRAWDEGGVFRQSSFIGFKDR